MHQEYGNAILAQKYGGIKKYHTSKHAQPTATHGCCRIRSYAVRTPNASWQSGGPWSSNSLYFFLVEDFCGGGGGGGGARRVDCSSLGHMYSCEAGLKPLIQSSDGCPMVHCSLFAALEYVFSMCRSINKGLRFFFTFRLGPSVAHSRAVHKPSTACALDPPNAILHSKSKPCKSCPAEACCMHPCP
jgi:hypothetical protein